METKFQLCIETALELCGDIGGLLKDESIQVDAWYEGSKTFVIKKEITWSRRGLHSWRLEDDLLNAEFERTSENIVSAPFCVRWIHNEGLEEENAFFQLAEKKFSRNAPAVTSTNVVLARVYFNFLTMTEYINQDDWSKAMLLGKCLQEASSEFEVCVCTCVGVRKGLRFPVL